MTSDRLPDLYKHITPSHASVRTLPPPASPPPYPSTQDTIPIGHASLFSEPPSRTVGFTAPPTSLAFISCNLSAMKQWLIFPPGNLSAMKQWLIFPPGNLSAMKQWLIFPPGNLSAMKQWLIFPGNLSAMLIFPPGNLNVA
nr:uncharacterized protein LOC113821926 [Penaeus vannamei]